MMETWVKLFAEPEEDGSVIELSVEFEARDPIEVISVWRADRPWCVSLDEEWRWAVHPAVLEACRIEILEREEDYWG